MTTFSERYGYTKPGDVLQVESANVELRTSIYNFIYSILGEYELYSSSEVICKQLWTMKWHKPAYTFPGTYYDFYPKLYEWILTTEWYRCYDLIEFVFDEINDCRVEDFELEFCIRDSSHSYSSEVNFVQDFGDALNYVLEAEGSGYRFSNGQIIPITNKSEIEAIEQAIESASVPCGARSHIQKALVLLSRMPNPDYLNSIKESISAAESVAKKLTSGCNNTLADALSELQKEHRLHKSLVDAWKKMFGYTSDADGIRHAGSDEPVQLDFAFAKYMLVTCSAFVNYLAEEYGPNE